MTEDSDIFEVAQQLPHGERLKYLEEVCRGDEKQKERVLDLLSQANTVLEPAPVARLIADHAERPGDQIGPFKLLEKIGEGGFGLVFMAEQREPIRRRVALKVIKQGMDTKQVIARFEAERQALALMDHPNIAKVLDAGATDRGRPYFVMELVKGLPVTKFCDEERLDTRQRLKLFMAICTAVQHAHQKGIIHRDLKPSNILVALQDGKPLAKVIDFGIAKATQQELTEKTLFTRADQFLGTPLYISPEQANLNAVDIDTRSDIYSLGVVLYELLAGKPPIDAQELLAAGYDEMRRLIREKEAPKPSTRLSTATDQEIEFIARARRTAPKKLGGFVRGELDWIILKAVEKDRARRYETANALNLDLQRFLDDEPVSASPPSAAYRLRKFARRHKATLATVFLVMLALIAGIIGTSWQAIRAKQSARDAAAALAEKGSALEAKLVQERKLKELLREVSEADQFAATRLFDENRPEEALALLERALRFDPSNRSAIQQALLALKPPAPANQYAHQWTYHSDWVELNEDPLTESSRVGAKFAFSPDSSKIALVAEQRLRVFDVSTGVLDWELEGVHGGVEFSPDGARVITRSIPDSIQMLNATTGTRLWTTTLRIFGDHRFRFSPNGKRILLFDSDPFSDQASGSFLGILDAETGSILRTDLPSSVLHVSFLEDNSLRALHETEGMLRMTNEDQGSVLWESPLGEIGPVDSNGAQIAVLVGNPAPFDDPFGNPDPFGNSAPEGNPKLAVLDAATGHTLWELTEGEPFNPPDSFGDTIRLSPDGTCVAVSTRQDGLSIINAPNVPRSPYTDAWRVDSPDGTCVFSPDGSLTALAGTSEIRILRMLDHSEFPRILVSAETVGFSPDGAVLAAWIPARGLSLYGPSIGLGSGFCPTQAHIGQIAFTDDGRIAGYHKGTLTMYDPIGDGVGNLEAPPPPNTKISTLEGSDVLLEASSDRVRLLPVQPAGDVIMSGSPDGSMVAVSSPGKPLRVMNPAGDTEIWRSSPPSDITSLAFSPDNTRIATGGLDRTVRVYNATTGRALWNSSALGVQQSASANGSALTGLTFSPDGTTILASSRHSLFALEGVGGIEMWNRHSTAQVVASAFDSSGSKIVVLEPEDVHVLNSATGAELWKSHVPIKYPNPYVPYIPTYSQFSSGSLAFDPHGERMACVFGQNVRVFEINTGMECWRGAFRFWVNSVAYDQQGNRLAVSTDDAAIHTFPIRPLPQSESDVVAVLRQALRCRAGRYYPDREGLVATPVVDLESYPARLHAAIKADPGNDILRTLNWVSIPPVARTATPDSDLKLRHAFSQTLVAYVEADRGNTQAFYELGFRNMWHPLAPLAVLIADGGLGHPSPTKIAHIGRLTLARLKSVDVNAWGTADFARDCALAAEYQIWNELDLDVPSEAVALALHHDPNQPRALKIKQWITEERSKRNLQPGK